MNILKAIMIGDVVGEPGLKILEEKLPDLIKDNAVDFTVVNGENTADGFGMTEAALKRITACGADVVTSGNHVWEKRDFIPILESNDNVLRPSNYPGKAAGRGWLCREKAGITWLVINLQGREFMTPIDCPFRCFDNIINNLSNNEPKIILVDFHAESSREKEALGYYIDGRASLIVCTHTHVQTADERILPKGTGYITDLGMTGNHDSVIGMDKKICIERSRRQILFRMEPAAEKLTNGISNAEVNGIIAEIDADTGKAISIKRL